MILIIDFYVDFNEVKDFVYSAVVAEIDAIDSRKQTPLHTAAREGKVKIVQLLCKKGANLRLKDHEGNIPLNLAAEREQNCEFSSVSL